MAQNSGKTAKRKPRGKPFPKGVSGNPGGRPKSLSTLVREATDDGAELVKGFVDVWKGNASYRVGKDESARDVPPSWKDRLEAGRWLSDHGFGKPTQTLEHTGAGGGPLEVRIVSYADVEDDE